MDLRTLQNFLAVAKMHSISAAAVELNISQPALSTQLRQLEHELGKQLLIRGTRGSRRTELTNEGVIVQKRAEEMLALAQKMKGELSCGNGEIEGDVVIGAGELGAVRLLAQAARRLSSQYPKVRFHIKSGNADYVFDQIDRGLVDLGLVVSGVDPNVYQALALPTVEQLGVLMRRDDPLAGREAIAPENLLDRRLIIPNQRGDCEYISGWMNNNVTDLDVVATYSLVHNASVFVEEGFGVAIALDQLVNTEKTELCFKPLDPPMRLITRLIWKKSQVLTSATEAYLDVVRATIVDPRFIPVSAVREEGAM